MFSSFSLWVMQHGKLMFTKGCKLFIAIFFKSRINHSKQGRIHGILYCQHNIPYTLYKHQKLIVCMQQPDNFKTCVSQNSMKLQLKSQWDQKSNHLKFYSMLYITKLSSLMLSQSSLNTSENRLKDSSAATLLHGTLEIISIGHFAEQ